ncbi:hypothetical protein K1T71_014815 [Dendrolimus kikuchii]|nr:hypothetical protein K1T71_014815 [Dendrolimus kikuchii]
MRRFMELTSRVLNNRNLILILIQCCFSSTESRHFKIDIGIELTAGAAFCAKTMQSNGKDFNVGIWDTAGSERYEAMTKIYYRGAHAAIICYEPSSIESWNRLRHYTCLFCFTDELFQKIVDDCAADVKLMRDVEELRVQLLKDEAAFRGKNKEYCLC